MHTNLGIESMRRLSPPKTPQRRPLLLSEMIEELQKMQEFILRHNIAAAKVLWANTANGELRIIIRYVDDLEEIDGKKLEGFLRDKGQTPRSLWSVAITGRCTLAWQRQEEEDLA